MRTAIVITMALLGTILVLSGAAALWASALAGARSTDDPGTARRVDRTMTAMSRLPAPDRLITWGVVLLALSAIASGAIMFSVSATAGTS